MSNLDVERLPAGPAGVVLRLLSAMDAQSLAELEASVFADAWDARQFAELLGQDRFLAAGAFDGQGLCGYLTAYSLAGELEIVNVAVAPGQRGKGIGRALVMFSLREGAVKGVRRAVLEVRSGNLPARALYARCGFTQAGLRRGYYSDTGEDALVLEWTDGPGAQDE